MLAIFLAQIHRSLLSSEGREERRGKENLLSLHPTRKAANDYTCLRASAQKRERGREKEAFSCPLLPRGAITDTSATLFLLFSSLLPSFHSFFLRKQSRFVRYLALSGVCLVSWSVRLMFGASPPLLSSLPSVRPSALGDTRCRLV